MKRTILAILFSFVFSTGVFSTGYCKTLVDLKTDIRREIQDTDSSRQAYSDSYLLDFVNEAQRDVNNSVGLLQEVSSYVLTPRTTYYSLPTDYMSMVYVEFKNASNQAISLDEVTLKSALSRNPNWRSQSGSPSQYYIDDSTSSVTPVISYIPIPTNTSTGTVTLTYNSIATDLSSDSDVPFNGKRPIYPFHSAITYYVSMRIKAIEKKQAESGFYATLYGNSLNAMKARLQSMPNFNPSFGAK